MPAHENLVRELNPILFSKMALRPEFLGEIDRSRLVGCFSGEMTDGGRLALKSFLIQQFNLQRIEVVTNELDLKNLFDVYETSQVRIDMLCLDADSDLIESAISRESVLDLLSEKALVCVETNEKFGASNLGLLGECNFLSVFQSGGFSVLVRIDGERSPRSVSYQIDLFQRQRSMMEKRQQRLTSRPPLPEVAVFVLTYMHNDFIAECLHSVIKQTGNFTMRVLVIDDASPDNTAGIARSIISRSQGERIKLELRVNPQNVGASANWGAALKWAEGADYVTFLDGDDFWSSKFRVQRHIDFLEDHPRTYMSFNTFEFCAPNGSSRRKGITLDKEVVGSERIVKDNPVGHLGATFYRGEIVDIFPIEPFYYINGDWAINVYCSQIADVGYIDETLSVYRLHSGGVWGLKGVRERLLRTIEAILLYNAFTDFNFSNEFNDLICDRYKEVSGIHLDESDWVGKSDLIVMHQKFPGKDSFEYREATSILTEFPSALLLSSLNTDYQRRYPEFGSRTIEDGGEFPLQLSKLIYVTSLEQAYEALARIEAACVPFVLCLDQDLRRNAHSLDMGLKLSRVCLSPYFQRVIVPSEEIRDFIIDNELCAAEKVELISRSLNDQQLSEILIAKRRWGDGKTHLDICLLLRPFGQVGAESSAGIFIEVVKLLQKLHSDIVWHVIGADLPIGEWDAESSGSVNFYESLTPNEFESFFREIDIVLSYDAPNLGDVKSWDPSQEELCVYAAARGVAVFTTKKLDNAGFREGVDYVAINRQVDDIIDKVRRFYSAPEALKELAENGARSVQRDCINSTRFEIATRIRLLRAIIGSTLPYGEARTLEYRASSMRAELAHLREQLAALERKKEKRSQLLRGVKRFVAGQSETTAAQLLSIFGAGGFRGLRKALRDIGS